MALPPPRPLTSSLQIDRFEVSSIRNGHSRVSLPEKDEFVVTGGCLIGTQGGYVLFRGTDPNDEGLKLLFDARPQGPLPPPPMSEDWPSVRDQEIRPREFFETAQLPHEILCDLFDNRTPTPQRLDTEGGKCQTGPITLS